TGRYSRKKSSAGMPGLLLLLARTRQVERHQVQQLAVSELGQHAFGPVGLDELLREPELRRDQRVDLLLDRPPADELVDEDVPLLADAVRPVGRLVLDGGIPPAVEVHDVRGGRQVEARAAGLRGEDEEADAVVLLEALDEARTLLHRRRAREHEAGQSEDRAEELGERTGGLAELGEDERLLLLGGDRLRDLAQAKELPAPVLLPAAVAEVVRRVVADLLQPEQVREDDPTAPGFVRPCPELPRER